MGVAPAIWRTRPATPEQALAAAVISQAYVDMFSTISGQGWVDAAADEAMNFLTTRHGTAAKWRNRWCDFLGMDGDLLAARVRAMLDGEIDPAGDPHLTKRIEHARARWARLPKAPEPKPAPEPKASAKVAPTPLPQRLPTIKPAPRRIEPEDVDVSMVDDPFYPAEAGHMRASRRWDDGETSRYLGPLPSLRTPVGQALWTITQVSRSGQNALRVLADDPHGLVETLRAALPSCEIVWTANGQRLPEYQRNAGLRLYLKESCNTSTLNCSDPKRTR